MAMGEECDILSLFFRVESGGDEGAEVGVSILRVGVWCVSLAYCAFHWRTHGSRTCYGILARAASSWDALARHSGFHRTARDALFRAPSPQPDSLTSRR